MRVVPMMMITGRTSSTITMRTAPSMASSSPDVGPRLHFDQRAERQLGDADGGAGRAVIAEYGDVGLVHLGVVAHVAQEDRGLDHVGQLGALGGELRLQVVQALGHLSGHTAGDDAAVGYAHLA